MVTILQPMIWVARAAVHGMGPYTVPVLCWQSSAKESPRSDWNRTPTLQQRFINCYMGWRRVGRIGGEHVQSIDPQSSWDRLAATAWRSMRPARPVQAAALAAAAAGATHAAAPLPPAQLVCGCCCCCCCLSAATISTTAEATSASVGGCAGPKARSRPARTPCGTPGGWGMGKGGGT